MRVSPAKSMVRLRYSMGSLNKCRPEALQEWVGKGLEGKKQDTSRQQPSLNTKSAGPFISNLLPL